jgi:hypothetical protein
MRKFFRSLTALVALGVAMYFVLLSLTALTTAPLQTGRSAATETSSQAVSVLGAAARLKSEAALLVGGRVD